MASSLAVVTRNRDFRTLFAAELVVFGADWFVLVPLLVLLPELTGSGVWGALVLAADTGIIALVLPYAGTVADRIDRKKIMMASNLVALGAVLLLLLVRSAGTAWVAVAVVGAVAVAKGFYSPAASAALPNVVDAEDLPAANALSGSAWGTMLVVGASLGGIASALCSVRTGASAASSALCFLSAALVARVRRPLQTARGSQAAEIGEAVRLHPQAPAGRLALVTVKAAVGLGNGVLTTCSRCWPRRYGVGPLGVGLLFAARGLGALIGPFVALRRVLTHPSWLLPGLAVSMSVYGLTYMAVVPPRGSRSCWRRRSSWRTWPPAATG